MVQFNFSERTIKSKVVYYGPPQSGKTTNLEQIHRLTDPEGANRLISLNTAQDRTLFFDLLPFSLGTVSGYDFKVQLYTVPGQVQYNATRRVVLAGADAVVFIADSQTNLARENQTAFENMKVNLLANRLVPEKVPLVLQYNKRDLDQLIPLADLDSTLNPWGRKTFPAVAAQGEGVLETFAAVVQEMLTAIAHKYNLKEKGLDPASVPDVVAQAFEDLLRNGPSPGRSSPSPSAPAPAPSALPERPRPAAGPDPPAAPLPSPAAPSVAVAPAPAPGAPGVPVAASPAPVREAPSGSPGKIVMSQPAGAEPAYPGQAGPDANPVSEELLHRAIRSNVQLAEALGSFVRDVQVGLGTILSHADQLATGGGDGRRGELLVGSIRREVARLRRVIQDLGDAGTGATGAASPKAPPVSPSRPAAAPRPVAAPAARPAPPPAASIARPVARASVAPAAAATVPTLDGLVAEVTEAVRAPLASRGLSLRSALARGTPLPRCPPAALRRAMAALFQGLSELVAPGSTLAVRAERKPVLLRGRDGREQRRDFLMLALTHTAGLTDDDQRRVLKGKDPGRLGDAYRLVREMGGFLRFAPLPGALLETRVFLPV
jgi:signal recognition particle receptor subunit beta